MYAFGRRSQAKLVLADDRLQAIANRVMRYQVYDFTVVWTFRNEQEQEQAYISGTSRVRGPNSKHNKRPAVALDFAPWVNGGIPWHDTHAFAVIGGFFLAAGAELGIALRYGGVWDMDGQTTDQRLMDWGHVELIDV